MNNPGQNIWNKVEESSETGQEKKRLISTFTCFLTAIAKDQFLEGRLATWSPLRLTFSNFLRLQILSRSATRDNTKFAILDIVFRFTCEIGPVLKHCKVPKYYDQDCRYQILL